MKYLVANRSFTNFRCVIASLTDGLGDVIRVSDEVSKTLNINDGGQVVLSRCPTCHPPFSEEENRAMMLIRHIASKGSDDLLRLAENTGIGVTTLPANRDLLAAKIERSGSIVCKNDQKKKRSTFFALEDTERE